MNFDFGYVLSRAWRIIWKHKILWLFGIFAGCSRGGGGGSGSGGGGGGEGFSNGSDFGREFEQYFEQAGQWINENWWIFIVVGVVVLFLILISMFLGTIGRIALIRGTYQAEAGVESLSFGNLFSESLPYFWRVLGLSLLIGLAFLVVLLPVVLIGFLTAGVGFVCLLPLICIFIPVALVVNLVLEQANVAIVVENLGILDGFRRGWQVCKANLGPVIIMALILWVGSGIAGFVIAIPIIAAFLPAFFGMINNDFATPMLIAGLCFVAYLPVLILLSGILTAYIQTAWALTYQRLTKPPENAPVVLEVNA